MEIPPEEQTFEEIVPPGQPGEPEGRSFLEELEEAGEGRDFEVRHLQNRGSSWEELFSEEEIQAMEAVIGESATQYYSGENATTQTETFPEGVDEATEADVRPEMSDAGTSTEKNAVNSVGTQTREIT